MRHFKVFWNFTTKILLVCCSYLVSLCKPFCQDHNLPSETLCIITCLLKRYALYKCHFNFRSFKQTISWKHKRFLPWNWKVFLLHFPHSNSLHFTILLQYQLKMKCIVMLIGSILIARLINLAIKCSLLYCRYGMHNPINIQRWIFKCFLSGFQVTWLLKRAGKSDYHRPSSLDISSNLY